MSEDVAPPVPKLCARSLRRRRQAASNHPVDVIRLANELKRKREYQRARRAKWQTETSEERELRLGQRRQEDAERRQRRRALGAATDASRSTSATASETDGAKVVSGCAPSTVRCPERTQRSGGVPQRRLRRGLMKTSVALNASLRACLYSSFAQLSSNVRSLVVALCMYSRMHGILSENHQGKSLSLPESATGKGESRELLLPQRTSLDAFFFFFKCGEHFSVAPGIEGKA